MISTTENYGNKVYFGMILHNSVRVMTILLSVFFSKKSFRIDYNTTFV